MPSITLPLNEAIVAFSGILPHVSKDDVTPVITHANIIPMDPIAEKGGETITPTGSWLVATDRYTVVRYPLSSTPWAEWPVGETSEVPVMIPRALMVHILTLTPPKLRFRSMFDDYKLRITVTDVSSTLELLWGTESSGVERVEQLMTFDPPSKGNYPPTARLFEKDVTPAEGAIAFNPEYLERFTAFAKKFGRDELMQIEVSGSDIAGKPGPMRVNIGKLEGLIQPRWAVR